MALFSKSGLAKFALVSGSSVGVVFLLLRNVSIAKLIGPDLYGVAVFIQAISAAADLLSDLGWDKFLIQSDVKDRQASQGVVHFLRLATGVVVGLIIIVASPFLAHAIKVPAATGAIAAIAVVVLLRCATHTDYKFRQRQMNFKGELVIELSRFTADLIVALVVGLLLKSYWAMTWALIANAAAGCIASHIMADQPYRPKWQPVLGREVYHFGAPLLFNNFIIYLAGQGDRPMVGMAYSPRVLAIYGASLQLISGPQAVINRILLTLSLPILSRSRTDPELYATRHRQLGMATICAAAAISFPVISLGSDAVRLIYGKAYHPDPRLIAALVIPQSINIIRTWTMSSLMAHAKTKVIPLVNMTRLVGLCVGSFLAFRHYSLVTVAYCLMAGETIGLFTQLGVHRKIIMKEDSRIIFMLAALGIFWFLATVIQSFEVTLMLKIIMAIMPVFIICGGALILEIYSNKARQVKAYK